MKAFTFVRPTSLAEVTKAAAVKGTAIKASGIDLLDRMKERVDQPDSVVWLGDVKSLHSHITDHHGGMMIGAMTTLAELAASERARRAVAALAEAAGLAASPQIRARATLGGNLCQHTRCGYYRHASFPCFKRGDAECPALADGAVQETAAVFGNGACASAHPSSLAPVLCAIGATLLVQPATGEMKRIPIREFYLPPERGTASDAALAPGDVIVDVWIRFDAPDRTAYEEIRQKAAFDWALVSCCVRLDMDGDKVKDAGVWLGSVAPTPWHAEAAERALVGKSLTDDVIRAAADAAVTGATPLPGNGYKVDLVKVVVRRALERLRSQR